MHHRHKGKVLGSFLASHDFVVFGWNASSGFDFPSPISRKVDLCLHTEPQFLRLSALILRSYSVEGRGDILG